ncbi:MAG: hypothetical protein FJ137_13050 [Deltaproteobacteria bacterium]|nr:hypothetical protein [Deltaproteobacteria bacterium]
MKTRRWLMACAWWALPGCQLGAGEPCLSTVECQSDLECVVVSLDTGPASTCLPRLARREPAQCVDECSALDSPWPVEAACVDGACACDVDAFGCEAVSGTLDPKLFLVDPATCLCRAVGEGDPCETNRCPGGLGCVDGRCRAG